VFMWTGAVAVCLTKEELNGILYHLAAPLLREVEMAENDSVQTPLLKLANEVISKLKKKVGVDEFADCAVKLQARMMEKRAKKKTREAQEVRSVNIFYVGWKSGSINVYICLSIYLPIHSSIHLPIYLYPYISIHLPIYLYPYISINLPTYPCIYLFI